MCFGTIMQTNIWMSQTFVNVKFQVPSHLYLNIFSRFWQSKRKLPGELLLQNSKFGTILGNNLAIYQVLSMRVLCFTTHVWQNVRQKNSICILSLQRNIDSVFVMQTEGKRVIRKRMKTCSMDFHNKDLDISFYVFKPTVVIVDHLVHGLQQFSLLTQNLGCVQSSIFRSIHGNMVSSSYLSLILYFLNSVSIIFQFSIVYFLYRFWILYIHWKLCWLTCEKKLVHICWYIDWNLMLKYFIMWDSSGILKLEAQHSKSWYCLAESFSWNQDD